MKIWIRKYLGQLLTLCFVLQAHLILFFIYSPIEKKTYHSKKPVVVRTYFQASPKPQKGAIEKRVKGVKTTAAQKKSPSSKKEESLPSKISLPKKQPLSMGKPVPLLPLPGRIHALHIDTPLEEQSSYLTLAIQTLQQTLELPEDGDVKVELTVLKSGDVEKFQILYAESDKNRYYLESALARLHLPQFSGELARQSRHTFRLIFCYEK